MDDYEWRSNVTPVPVSDLDDLYECDECGAIVNGAYGAKVHVAWHDEEDD